LIGPKLDVVLRCDCEAHVCFLHFFVLFLFNFIVWKRAT